MKRRSNKKKHTQKKKGFLLFCQRIYGFLGCGHLLSVLLTVCRYLTHKNFISTQNVCVLLLLNIILTIYTKENCKNMSYSFWRQWRTLYAAYLTNKKNSNLHPLKIFYFIFTSFIFALHLSFSFGIWWQVDSTLLTVAHTRFLVLVFMFNFL